MVRERRKKRNSGFHLPQRLEHRPSVVKSVLDIIGIRPFQHDAPLTQQQKTRLIRDILISTIIFLLAVVSRFYRLATPDKIVFDEVHFAAFIHQYFKGTYLFDIHPPLGKLTLVAVAKLFGYQPIDYSFKLIGQPFGQLLYYPQRAFAALIGCFIPPVLYLTARTLSLSIETSLTTAAMPLFDFLLCIESRLILTDSQLIFYLQAAYLSAFLLWQTPRSTPRRYILVVTTAIAAACALSTKWTAFVAPLFIALISLTGILFPFARLDVLEMGVAAIIAAVIYIGCFWIHFQLLPLSGPGDGFMKTEFQATLPGNKHYNPHAPAPSFAANFWYLNWEMLRANSAITARHPWESKWYEWLYNARGILYSDIALGNGLREQVYLVANPVLSVITAIGVVASLIFVGTHLLKWITKTPQSKSFEDEFANQTSSSSSSSNSSIRGKHRRGRKNDGEKEEKLQLLEVKRREVSDQTVGLLIMLFLAWCGNLFPYIGISRCTFIYHLLPSLEISSIMTGIMLDKLPTKRGFRTISNILLIAAMAAAYYRWRPWIYALPRSFEQLKKLRLLPRWD